MTTISSAKPARIQRADLYKRLIGELKSEVEPKLSDTSPRTSATTDYGRADRAATQMLLARLYMNAEVYTGTTDQASAKLHIKKVIDSPYKLYTTKKDQWSTYQQLFMGDNDESGASIEAIFPILQDGLKITSYGTTLYLMADSSDNSEHIKSAVIAGNSTTGGRAGNRMYSDLVSKFFPNNDAPNVAAYAMPVAADDDRAPFDGEGRNVSNGDDEKGVKAFTNGFSVCKFNNFKTDGGISHNSLFPDADFFLMRVAEAYLMYAEAGARQSNGTTTAQGTVYINALRMRANVITQAAYSLRQICDGWSRELYLEDLRRTIFVRFGYFDGNVNYNWSWKGSMKSGRNLDPHLNLFPIPTNDMVTNSNLVQDIGH